MSLIDLIKSASAPSWSDINKFADSVIEALSQAQRCAERHSNRLDELERRVSELETEIRKSKPSEEETDSSSVFMPEWAPGVPDVEFVCTHGDYVDKPNGPRGNMRLVRYTRNPKEEKYVSNRHKFDNFPG